MTDKYTILLAGMVIALLAGCESGPKPAPDDFMFCGDPRPEVCTMEYDPVCARLQGGTRKTYASGCTACSDSSVTGHRPKACL